MLPFLLIFCNCINIKIACRPRFGSFLIFVKYSARKCHFWPFEKFLCCFLVHFGPIFDYFVLCTFFPVVGFNLLIEIVFSHLSFWSWYVWNLIIWLKRGRILNIIPLYTKFRPVKRKLILLTIYNHFVDGYWKSFGSHTFGFIFEWCPFWQDYLVRW